MTKSRDKIKNPKTCSLAVKGMDCAACLEKIETTLKKHRGIESAKAHIGTEKVEVSFDSSVINLKAIENIIKKAGYKIASSTSKDEKTIEGCEIVRMGIVLCLILLSLAGFGSSKEFYGVKLRAALEIAAVLIGGYPLFRHALIDLRAKSVTADVFMALGITAAAAIGEFRSAAVIAFFMLIAEFLDSFTMEKSRRAIKELIEMAPKTATVKRNGAETEIPIGKVKKGDVAVVKPGEKIPVEGIIVSGRGFINQSPITGESLPVEKKEGEYVYAATVNQTGVFFIKVTHTGEDTTYARIIKLIEEAESSKAPVQKIADKFATYFTPAILAIAVFTYLFTWKITSAIAVVVVACPCTIAIATPLAVVAGMGKAAKKGIIIKGGRYLEALARADTIVMDKTGTLTIGDPEVTDIKGFSGFSNEDVISYTAGMERYSEHPLAKAIMKRAFEKQIEVPEPHNYKVLTGMGIEAVLNGSRMLLGSRELLRGKNISVSEEVENYIKDREEEGKTVLLLSSDGKVCGVLAVSDVIREGTVEAINELSRLGFAEMIMLTGDNPATAKNIASSLGIKKTMSRLLPEDKVKKIKELVSNGRYVLMVGDGINDAPALAQAHVGVAMGAVGSDAAIEASDVTLMRDEWKQITEAVKIGRSTFAIIKQNLALGIIFNLAGISLASAGILTPSMAAVAHVMPDVFVFLNSARIMK